MRVRVKVKSDLKSGWLLGSGPRSQAPELIPEHGWPVQERAE